MGIKEEEQDVADDGGESDELFSRLQSSQKIRVNEYHSYFEP